MTTDKPIKGVDYCIVCGNEPHTLGEDPGGMFWQIEIPSCKTKDNHIRKIWLCVRCSDDLRNFLTGKKEKI